MSKTQIGIQLYTVRDLTDDASFKETLTELARLGFTGVEFAWKYGGMEPEQLAAFLKSQGLQCCGLHVQIAELLDPRNKVYEYARAANSEFITTSAAGSVADWAAVLANINEAGKVARSNGFRFTYHNHWQEFAQLDGKYAQDILIAETDPEYVELEIDIGWVTKGGEDAMAYWRKHAARTPQIHLRDFDAGADQDCDVGDGFIELDAVFAQASELGTRWLIYEQSTYPVSSIESCRTVAKRLAAVTGV